MPVFTLSESYVHPEGVFSAQLVEWSETVGQFGPQIKWIFETPEVRDDGTQAKLNYFTGTNISPKSKLGALIEAMGLPLPATVEEATAFDPERLVGKVCRVKVVHSLGKDGREWGNIEQLAPAKRAAAPAAPAGKSPPVDPEGKPDPFADEA